VEDPRFEEAYEQLKVATMAFRAVTEETIFQALNRDSLCLLVLRTILGVTPPEWAELARQDGDTDIDPGFARSLNNRIRTNPQYFQSLRHERSVRRLRLLVRVGCAYLNAGAPTGADDVIHRLNKFDTSEGLVSLQNAADRGVPYAVWGTSRILDVLSRATVTRSPSWSVR
jgi:hypothetical protein